MVWRIGAFARVSGGVVSRSQLLEAGVGAARPPPSPARTFNVEPPSGSPEYSFGELHGSHNPPSKRWHSNVTFSTSNSNVKRTGPLAVGGGDVILVSGGVLRVENVRAVGGSSVLPASSVARVSNV